MGVKWGVTRRKMQEYLKDLELTEFIDRQFGEIFLKEEPIRGATEKEFNEILQSAKQDGEKIATQ